MFSNIRRYRLTRGTTDELVARVDDGFAEEICAQPGFMSYELLDCGDDEFVTISSFGEAHQAEASRRLAERWTRENLSDMEVARLEVLRGEVWVSRARSEMLEPAHASTDGKFGSIRRCWLRAGAVWELLHIADEVFADEIERLDWFEAYHALACGRGEIATISLFRDRSAAEHSDERALRFVAEQLGAFDIERTEVIGGEVRVSRASAELLQPAHA
jgi:hypothetical protein